MSNEIVVAFDLYGTLLSTASIAKQLAEHFGEEKATTIATAWRKYQLEYTWRLNSMKQYKPFDTVTRASLHNALLESKVSLTDKETEDLMAAYDTLDIYPDAADCLSSLTAKPHIQAVVFSNGTHEMIASSIHKSPQLAKFSSSIQSIVSIDDVKQYKPAPESYAHLARQVGKDPSSATDMQSIWLVSGNPFDIVGARTAGLSAAWIDREDKGWQDGLGEPTVVVQSLEQVVDAVSNHR
ncbi:hypothetical protein ANO11243_044240 [Dothideomycetidae sp. 11243]|nr:hypothetical protein ANO11243_044240 [fungal sp. No.11243]